MRNYLLAVICEPGFHGEFGHEGQGRATASSEAI